MIHAREVVMDKRAAPRFPFKMRAYALDGGRQVTFESEDISAGGVYLLGDPRVAEGDPLWLRLELVIAREGKEWVYPVDAEVEVVRVTRGSDGEALGFAGRWRTVSSHGDIEPIREFLRRVLSISSGFVQRVGPRTELDKPLYVFTFPTPEPLEESAPKAVAKPDEAAGILEDPAAYLDGSRVSGQSVRTGIYVILPMTYRMDDDEYEGRAVKLREHGMRIATNGPLPEVYRRVAVRIPMRHKDRPTSLELVSTVTTLRRGAGEGEGQFEVEFGLANDPDKLNTYRKMLERLSKTLADSQGL